MPSCSGTLGRKQPRAPFAGAHESVCGFAQTLASSYLVATLRVSQRGTESNSISLRKARSENYFGAKYRKQVFSSHPSLFMPMPRGSRCFPNGEGQAVGPSARCRWASSVGRCGRCIPGAWVRDRKTGTPENVPPALALFQSNGHKGVTFSLLQPLVSPRFLFLKGF